MCIQYKDNYFIKTVIGTDYRSNCYIIWNNTSKHVIIIDPNDFIQISTVINQYQLSIDYILLTHEHYDHIAALHKVQNYFGGKTIASQKCKEEMPKTQDRLNKTFRLYLHFIGVETTDKNIPNYQEGRVDITFVKTKKFKWEELSFHIQETIGHSKGSVSILMDNTYIFSGDSVLEGKPIITNYLGGNKEEYKQSTLFYYQQLDKNITILPGHGERFRLKEKNFYK